MYICIDKMTDLEGGDDDVGRVDTDGNGGGVGLFNVNSVDVDDPFLSVDLKYQYSPRSWLIKNTNLGDLSLPSLVLSSDNQDLVVLPDGDGLGLKGQRLCAVFHFHISLHAVSTDDFSLFISYHRHISSKCRLTSCFCRSSLLREEDIIFLFSPDGAAKCALRDFLRSDARPE